MPDESQKDEAVVLSKISPRQKRNLLTKVNMNVTFQQKWRSTIITTLSLGYRFYNNDYKQGFWKK